MSCTAYFRENVRVKRPYLTESICRAVIARAVRLEVQADGRHRYWGWSPELEKWIRVVVLADGMTLHNAFPDRDFVP
jgi:hypothetical protein